ncbi:hypothetical protein OIU85_029856 [Salix viminalis]|uniref:PIR2-like helical domain-containing protein n=1 Tax=Salix viminalis TaxID=40686 RepID=A0A9Q0T7L8_SALVM|nr:hypothetical protein OIU85_029856 [Salix viminalis]
MGCTARDKHVRANRRVPRPANYTEFDPCVYAKTLLESGLKPLAYHLGLHDPTHNNSDNNSNSNFDDNGWGYCTEEQLEETLLKNLDFLYKEAISKLVGLGYDEDVALKAILRNGHCYGGMDVLTNILHNSLAFLNNNNNDGGGGDNGNADETELVFDDLRQLEEYSLAGLVCLLQQVRPHLSKGDAMWCLLMCDLHVGRASALEIPFAGLPGNGSDNVQTIVESVGGVDNGIGGVAPALCRFHGGWGFGSGGGSEFSVNGLFSYGAEMSLQKDIEFPKRFNLSPSMKSLLKRNVAMFAADFRANSKQMQIQSQVQSQACMSVTAGGDAAPVIKADEGMVEKGEESQNSKNEDGVSLMLSKLQNLKLDENLKIAAEDQKDEMMVTPASTD